MGDEPISLGRLGQVLLRSWLLLTALTLLGAAAAFGAAQLLPSVYTATATQLIKGLPGTEVAANYQAAQYAVSRARSYPSFVYSSAVLEGVRGDLNNTETTEQLREDLSATNPVETPLLLVSATGATPEEARDKANSAARHLARFITQIETVAGRSPVSVETPVAAALPTKATSPRVALLSAMGAAIGFVVGALIAVARSATRARRSVRSTGSQQWWTDDSAVVAAPAGTEDLSSRPTGPPRTTVSQA